MDESYFLAGTLKFLAGDFFLTEYRFDKPFLTWAHLVPGILLFGKTPLGFHFSSLVFLFLAVKTWTQLFLSIFRTGDSEKETRLLFQSVVVFFTVLGFACTPLFVTYGAGSFADSALLFFLGKSLIPLLTRTKEDSKQSADTRKDWQKAWFWFACALCIKQTAVLYGPIYFFLWIKTLNSQQKSPAGFVAALKEVILFALKSGKVIYLIALFYMLSGPVKLAPLDMFWQARPDASSSGGILARLGEIADSLSLSVSIGLSMSSLLAILALVSQYRLSKKQESGKYSFQINLALAVALGLHFLALVFGGKYFDRYLLILLPQFFLTLSAIFSSSSIKTRLAGNILTLGLAILTCLSLSSDSWQKKLPSREWGQALYRIAEEYQEGSAVYANQLIWYTRPFATINPVRIICREERCLNDQFTGQKTPPRVPFFNNKPMESPIPTVFNYKTATLRMEEIKSVETSWSLSKLQGMLRLGQFKLAAITKNEDTYSFQFAYKKRCLPYLSTKNSQGDCLALLRITGQFVLTEGRLAVKDYGPGRTILGFRLNKVQILKGDQLLLDVSGLIPNLYKSYLQNIGPIDYSETGLLEIKNAQLSESGDKLTLDLIRTTF